MNNVSMNLHNYCSKLCKFTHLTQTDVGHFKQNYINSIHLFIIHEVM